MNYKDVVTVQDQQMEAYSARWINHEHVMDNKATVPLLPDGPSIRLQFNCHYIHWLTVMLE